jgi:peptidylprolyl isomerase
MAEAKIIDTVKVHYVGRLADSTFFDSSLDRKPLEFTIGRKMVIPGFEEGVDGMNAGETKTVSIASRDAYGPYLDLEDLVGTIKRAPIPPHIEQQVETVLLSRCKLPMAGSQLSWLKQ